MRGKYHVFRLFGKQRDAARAVALDVFFDEAHDVGI
jgi:hypothetical protein